jgi:2-keto-4-pentenoate hydratase/2-oxohepta-3-ene-1,7-dioic acid hydratase in catechol pathway
MKAATIFIRDESIFALEIDGQWFDFGKMLHAYSRLTPDMPATDNMALEEWTLHGLLWADKMAAIVTSLAETSALSDFAIASPEHFCLPFRPGKIICLGRNYAEHARELGNEVPESPLLFDKLPSTCIGDGEDILLDTAWGRVDYEGELAVVIGKRAKNVTSDEGMGYVCGYTLLNDVTARDLQSHAKKQGHPWLMTKNRDTFCPLGPAIALTDTVPEPVQLEISLKINGKVRQHGNTSQFICSIAQAVSRISACFALEPGDIIATGTPAGVGPLQVGDCVELEIPEIGVLRNTVKKMS